MITTVVTFSIPEPVTEDQAAAAFTEATPMFQGVPGLVRKYFLLSDDGQIMGGVYLWETRAHADAFHAETGPWFTHIQDTFGVAPAVTAYRSPVIVEGEHTG